MQAEKFSCEFSEVLGSTFLQNTSGRLLLVNKQIAENLEQSPEMRIFLVVIRVGSRTAATSKMERFVIIVNDWNPLTVITKPSILDVAAVLDSPLVIDFGMKIRNSVMV